MSLYQCTACGCCENTALSNYWVTKVDGGAPLCSACDPNIGKWHGYFDRVFLPMGMFKTNQGGNLEHIETGSEKVRDYAIPKPEHMP